MRFEHEFGVEAPPDRVWAFLMDIPRMATCIPGASDVTAIDESTYDATVVTKIGPISAKFGCRISILNLDNVARSGSVEVAGKDTKIGGGVKAKMEMALTGDEAGPTMVRIVSEVDIMGKIGQYGHGMISKRADAMLVDFANCARQSITADAG
jgi:carbon monoxide dehydrogenase subunit G